MISKTIFTGSYRTLKILPINRLIIAFVQVNVVFALTIFLLNLPNQEVFQFIRAT